MLTALIGVSILNSDLAELGSECQRMLRCGADYLHLDVMDGHFVPNLTFGHPVVKCLRSKMANAFLDVHMMVEKPELWITEMSKAGANQYTFHIEAAQNVEECIKEIKTAKMKVGIAVKPKTPVDTIIPFVNHVDCILIMTVEPGFGGQGFMKDMMPKVRLLRQQFPHLNIQVDGGIGPDTVGESAQAGANMIVSGSAIMKSDQPDQVISILRQAVNDVLVNTNMTD